MSSTLLHQHCQAYLARLSTMVREIGGKRLFNNCFVEVLFPGFVQSSAQHPCLVPMKVLFSPGVSLKFKWCNHTVGLIRQYLERIPSLFLFRDQIFI